VISTVIPHDGEQFRAGKEVSPIHVGSAGE